MTPQHSHVATLFACFFLSIVACDSADDAAAPSGNAGSAATGAQGGSAGNGAVSGSAGSGGSTTAGSSGTGGSGGMGATSGTGGAAGTGGSGAAGGTGGSGGTGGTGALGGTGGASGTAGSGANAGTGGSTVTCDFTGFDAVAQDALIDSQQNIKYLAQSTLGDPVDVFTFELVAPPDGIQPGEYPITDENYATCTNCITLYTACDAFLSNCSKTFLAISGSLTISEVGASGSNFSGSLANVTLVEVTIAPDLTSTKVENGATYCIPDYSYSAQLQ